MRVSVCMCVLNTHTYIIMGKYGSIHPNLILTPEVMIKSKSKGESQHTYI